MIEERPDYHLSELRVALDPAAPGHILPSIEAGHRRVLDEGCGAGQTLIACRLPPETLAVGIDPSLAALTLGRSLDARLHLLCGAGSFVRAEGTGQKAQARQKGRDASAYFKYSMT